MKSRVKPSARFVGYARVSVAKRAPAGGSKVKAKADGVSIAMQVAKIRLYAELHNLDLIKVVVDEGYSARTLDRPGFEEVRGLLDSGEAGGLVIFKLDRLTRSLRDWSGLIDSYFGGKGERSLSSVSESIDTRTAAGRMVLNLLMTIAEWERETIGERTQAAMDHKRSKGERVSRHLPYGFDLAPDRRSLVRHPDEMAVVGRMAEWKRMGASYRAIADRLQREQIPSKLGAKWSPTTVRSILARHRADAEGMEDAS